MDHGPRLVPVFSDPGVARRDIPGRGDVMLEFVPSCVYKTTNQVPFPCLLPFNAFPTGLNRQDVVVWVRLGSEITVNQR